MNIGAQSGLLAAIVAVAVTISVLMRGRKSLVSTLFAVFSGNLFIHYLAAFFHDLVAKHPDAVEKSIWFQIDLFAAACLPVTSLLFYGYFLWKQPELPNRYLKVSFIITGLLLVFLFLPWSHNQLTWAFVLIYSFAGQYVCAWLIYVRYQELDSRRDKTRLRYLLVFLLVALTFVLLGTIPGSLRFLRTWGNLVSVFYLYFVSQSLLKSRLLDIQELLGRTLVLTGVALLLAMVFGIAGGAPEVSLFHTFVASIVILILYEPLRDQVESSTHRMFFRERVDLRKRLEELRKEISNILDLERMSRALLDTPYENLSITHASIYLQEPGGAAYRLVEYRGPEPIGRLEVASHRAFFTQLHKTPTAILAETFERQVTDQGAPAESRHESVESQRKKSVLETLRQVHAGICIPLVNQGEILGLWNLHDENGLESYSASEIALLMSIGEQAAINIENSRIFERIRERDRLAVLGEMSAGLAHEIRNPLGAIKGAAQYLEPSSVGEDAAEFLNIIIEEVDRLNGVVNQFLDYARPFQSQLHPTDVNQVVSHTLKLVSAQLELKAIKLDVDLSSELPKMEANEQQLTQVFINLINNAIEAMPEGGTLKIGSSLRQPVSMPWQPPGPGTTIVQIEITDSGPGIPPEAMANIFVPFFTTKERGTGLGLAISQRIIENHGGEIRIRSRQGEGTTFLVVLTKRAQTESKEIEAHSAEPGDKHHAANNESAASEQTQTKAGSGQNQ